MSPRGGMYERGDDAELQLAIVNSGDEADTLVAVDGEGFGDVEIEGAASDELRRRLVALDRRSRSRPVARCSSASDEPTPSP